MNEIVFKKSNFGRIQEMLDEAQKRSSVRNISIEDMDNALQTVDKKLSIPQKYKNGIKINADINSQNFPNAYGYQAYAQSTHFTAVF